MKEMRGFDMLDNADDRTVDRLSEVPVLTKEEKERMLAMSKKKLDKMNRESNINISNDEFEVSGVERYKRPKWQIFTSAAACLLLVGGIVGTTYAMNRKGGAPSQQFAEVDETEPETEHDLLTTETVTEVSDEELSNIAKQLLENAETLDTLAGGIPVGFEFKSSDPKAVLIDDIKGVSYKQIEGIDSLDEIRTLLNDTFAEPIILEFEYKLFDGETPAFIERDGNILFTDKVTGHRFYFEGEPEITRNDDGSGFSMTVNTKSNSGSGQINFKAVNIDGKYKINNYSSSFGYAATEDNLNENADPMAIAYQAKIALNDVFKACNRIDIEVDKNDCMVDDESAQEFTDEWKTYFVDYYRVTDPRFTSIDDVVDYVSERVCGDFREALINDIKGGFMQKADKLYCLQNGPIDDIKPFDFTSKTKIADKTDSSMTVETSFILNGEETPLYIELYLIDGKWKIADYKF
ncbi:hypothetical protein [Ruminococcus sp.]|uniref:hypothetical protein n=1 Tax=Ruminococcus sp. TaxID=41978 RepID=UPI0025F81E35|nr:hypothetical protein [Ruminococcus sp.]MCR4638580.1 hypothetical protein [Ruminococcus sp.]